MTHLRFNSLLISLIVIILSPGYLNVAWATGLGLAPSTTRVGPYQLVADLGDMVVYADWTSPRATTHQTLSVSHLVQHEPSTDNTRSMVYHQEINCWARTIATVKVEHWSGNWGDGEVLLTEVLNRKPQTVSFRSLRSRLLDFFCSNYSLL